MEAGCWGQGGSTLCPALLGRAPGSEVRRVELVPVGRPREAGSVRHEGAFPMGARLALGSRLPVPWCGLGRWVFEPQGGGRSGDPFQGVPEHDPVNPRTSL